MSTRTQAGARGDARVVAGRYTLLERLGSGGMGTVWRARDGVLGRDVALKEVVFPAGVPAEDRDVLRERTRREARAAARLDHPSAITVYDVVEDDGAPFIVMELVQARTLADIVRLDGPLPAQRVAQVGLAVLGALTAAHQHGIVHRDVKPSNVLMCDAGDPAVTGRVVLTDFGIATSADDPSITSSGLLLGSPSYIAPERARGQQPGPASDLWSLGATLFTAVEGRAPFDAGDALATVAAVVVGEPAPFVHAGPLASVLEGLLERDPARRLDAPRTRALLQEIAAAAVPEPLAVPQPPASDPAAERTTVLSVGAVRREVASTEAAPAPAEQAAPAAPAPAEDVAPDPPPATDPAPAARARAVRQPAAPTGLTEPGPPSRAAPRPARPARPPRRRPAVLAAALAGIVLLGALVGLGAAALRTDAARSTSTAGGAPTAQPDAADPADDDPAADAAPGGTGADPAAPGAGAAPDEGPPEGASAGAGPLPAPEGWQTTTGGPGWTISVPPTYTQGSFRGSPEFRQAGTGRTLRVETTGPGGGGNDAVQDRRDQAASFARTHDDYREIAIAPIEYRGYEAADWEFTYRSDSTALHVLSRVFVVDGRGYSLYFQTRASDDWPAARAELERIAQSFVPA